MEDGEWGGIHSPSLRFGLNEKLVLFQEALTTLMGLHPWHNENQHDSQKYYGILDIALMYEHN